MVNKNIFSVFLIIAIILLTCGVVIVKPELHKTFQVQILKFIKADK